MRPLSRREQTLGGITLAVVVGAGLFIWFIDPALARHAKLQEEVSRLEASLTRMRANMLLKDQIEARYEELKGLARESGSPNQEMARFARLLSGLYSPLSLQTRSVRPLPDADEGFYRKYALRVEMAGNVAGIAKFLAAVAQASDPIRVERIELTCKERPEFVTATLVVTKVVTTGERPAAGAREGRPSGHPAAREAGTEGT